MRTAIVTGGSTGIGQSICEHLLAGGYRVVNISRRPSPVAHEHLHNYAADLADSRATKVVAERIAAEHEITAIVHNAGVIRPALLGYFFSLSVDLRLVVISPRSTRRACSVVPPAARIFASATQFSRSTRPGKPSSLPSHVASAAERPAICSKW